MKYEDISKNGYPLGFLIKKVQDSSKNFNRTFTSHTRQMDILQKETIGYEGDLNSSSFRLTSDEGKHLNGTDLAPFPLGFFNASIHGDIVGTVMKQAKSNGLKINNIDCEVLNSYYLTGSFVKGDGKGHAEPTTINLDVSTSENHKDIKNLILKASKMSPVLAGLRTPLKNTFALYSNGRRKDLSNLNIERLEIMNSKIIAAAYQKKPEYGPGFIKINNIEEKENEKDCNILKDMEVQKT